MRPAIASSVIFSGATWLPGVAGYDWMLPYSVAEGNANRQAASGGWWARIGDKVYEEHASRGVSLAQLGTNSSNYYYTVGNEQGLTEDMRAKRVGGDRLFHVLYLPSGPKELSLPATTDRRSSFSGLLQLTRGMALSGAEFPEYAPGTVLSPTLVPGGADSASHYKELLDKIVSNTDGDGHHSRSSQNKEATRNAQEMIQSEFRNMGLTTGLQGTGALANVVGFFPGDGSTKDTVTLGAHYDSRPFEGDAPGADDNGSGLAAMMLAAKRFMSGPSSSRTGVKKDVYFAAFGSEEKGLLGSAEWVDALVSGRVPEQLTRASQETSFLQAGRGSSFRQLSAAGALRAPVHHGLVLDEVGWKDKRDQVATINFESTDTPANREMMDQLFADRGDLKVVHNNNPFGSDHMSFLDKGQPATLLINDHDSDYPNYHQSTDTENNVDMEYGYNVSSMALRALSAFAKQP